MQKNVLSNANLMHEFIDNNSSIQQVYFCEDIAQLSSSFTTRVYPQFLAKY